VKLGEPQNNQQNFKSFIYLVRIYKIDKFIYWLKKDMVKVKVKFILEQVKEGQKESRDLTLHFMVVVIRLQVL
jgi:hypothetical protein